MSLRGLVGVLTSVAVVIFSSGKASGQPSNGITREVYINIAGGSVANLTSDPSFPDNPAIAEVLTNSFDCPRDVLDNYGQRLRALVVPPVTGAYTFWIASDDNSQLWLSTDANPATKRQIAYVNSWTSWKEWTKEPNQQSAPITLTAGQQYYIEALQKEGAGGDNLTVRWQLPSGTIEEPIPASRCIAYGVGAPAFLQQPTSITVVEGNQAVFAARITRAFGAALQWQRNGTNIPGANGTNIVIGPVVLSDSGSTFRIVATNPYGVTNSTNAALAVIADTVAPTISSVGNLGDNDLLTVVFSEPIEVASATALDSYAINNGVDVLSAVMGVDNRTVVLTTTPMAGNATYTLTVNNVRDRASSPNTILPNTQRTFSITPRPLDVGYLKLPPETVGPSTRRGPFIISEVMYHPTNRFDGRNVEFIEIYNSNPWFEEMGGFRITGAIDYTLPSNFVLQARSYAVIAAVPADVQAVYGLATVLGPWTGALQNGDGTLQIRNARGAVFFDMSYSGDFPFPASADGAGHSLVLARPSYGEGDPRAWNASDVIGGTPGAAEFPSANSYRNVMINEFLAHTDLPDLDYIELFNYSSSALNIAGLAITDDPSTNKFVVPTNTVIPANGFVVFYETNLGFALSAAGETIYLKNPQNTRVLDAVRFEGQENGVATGRCPDGAPEFHRLAENTPGTNNARTRTPSMVISEIMYDPLSDDSNDEFIELYNPGPTAINLGKWRIKDAVKFTIPNGTFLPANGCLVIAANAARLRTNYPGLNAFNCIGDWEGALRNSGERIALTMPDTIVSTNAVGDLVTNTIHIVMDEVTFLDGGRWGKWSGGGGSSLELRDWRSNRRLAPNWADSDNSTNSNWVNVEATDVMNNGNGTASQLHVTLLGPGECLIDDVQVIPASTGVNAIPNSTFESGTSGWVFQGNHNQTSWEPTAGFSSARSLHLRAVGRGDTGANRVRADLTSALANGTTVTLRAKVRWLKGNPNILLRLRGNYAEAAGSALTTKNLGTPGRANTAASTNAPPAITEVRHSPPLPAASQQVLVTARVHDPDGLATLLLKYRIDPSTNFTGVAMTNNGAGLYSAVIPGQANGIMGAFHVQAADRIDPVRGATFPNDAPVRECVVRWGDTSIPGSLGTYRMWLTQKTVDQWSNEERMSNNGKDVTFLYGTNRIVYNASAWFHGSPYHSPSYNSPVGNSCDYDMGFPSDDRLLGETDINLFRPGNGGGDGTGQTEIQAHWFARQFDLPFLNHRPVFVFVNGLRRDTIFHDAQQPNGDFVEQWFPEDSDGELHKIQLGFEFGDQAYGASEPGYSAVGADLNRYLAASGAFKQARYRQTWPLRSISAAEQNNYTNLFALVNTVLTTAPLNSDQHTTTLTNAVDVDEWFKVHVTQHLYNNTDSFSYGGGQNAFAYKPEFGLWNLLLWDVDFAFGGNASDSNLTGIGGAEHGPRNTHAPFARLYWQALIRAANTFMVSTKSNPTLDARYNGMLGAGASVSSPQGIKDFIATKRNVVLSAIAANQSPFTILSNGGADFSTNQNLITLTGTAPLDVRTIEINGVAYNLTWTTRSNWTLRVALPAGTNNLTITGYNEFGNVVSNSTRTLRVTVTAPPAQPEDFIVINEIMFNPGIPNAEYVELFNSSTNFSFELTGWVLNGIDFTFPEGTIMPPRTFLVLAKDRQAFAAAYGTNVVPFGVYAGNLKSSGETLSLIKPGYGVTSDVIIDKVRYDGAVPWPAGIPGTVSSVQVIDAKQDNSRVGNWSGLSWLNATPWRFAAATNTLTSTTPQLMMYLNGPGEIYIDDIYLVTGSTPAVGPNYVRNGDFESPLVETPAVTNSWVISANYSNSVASTAISHSGSSSLRMVCSQYLGSSTNVLIYQSISPFPVGQACVLSFWYLPTTNATTLNVRVRNSLLTINNLNVQPGTNNGPVLFTPGAANSFAGTLPAFPTLWINEVQAENLTGLTNAAGTHEPWIEFYNSGTNAIALDGLYLTSSYSNLTQWAFPTGVVVNPGAFQIAFADGQTNQTTTDELHTNFRLPPGNGSVALTRVYNGEAQVIDYLNYVAGLDHSYGSAPDGQPFTRQEFFYVTPGETNNGTLPPVVVYINEWMADNVGALPDPADGNYEDWFEIYNPGSNVVSLAGYFLTDALTNKFKFEIPAGYSIPSGGYLLVWADNESAQNDLGGSDLHVNFSLAKSGESLGLFTPDGVQVDAVTFLAQTSDVAMGRFPDGSGSMEFLTNYTPRAANVLPQSNVAPVLAPISDQTGFEGQLLSFIASATDGNFPPQQLTWSLEPGAPAGASINSSNGVFTWLPGESDGGSNYTVTVRVVDNGSPPLSDTETIIISIWKTNNAPVLSVPGDQVGNEGSLVSFVASATDPDSPAQQITFSLDPASLPEGASIDPTTGVFTWQPAEAHGPGAYTVTVWARDSGTPSLSNASPVSIVVNEVNNAPSLGSISNRTAALGETVSFTASVSDSDLPTQQITFDFPDAPPAGATINPTNGVFSWTANSVGTNTFMIRATDNGSPSLFDTRSFEVVVTSQFQITSIALSNDVVHLSWGAIPGRSYAIEFKNSLAELTWIPLATNLIAGTNTATTTDPIGTNTQRIYRIVLQP